MYKLRQLGAAGQDPQPAQHMQHVQHMQHHQMAEQPHRLQAQMAMPDEEMTALTYIERLRDFNIRYNQAYLNARLPDINNIPANLLAIDWVMNPHGHQNAGGIKRMASRKPNPWINHVKEYARINGVGYGAALKLARASYK